MREIPEMCDCCTYIKCKVHLPPGKWYLGLSQIYTIYTVIRELVYRTFYKLMIFKVSYICNGTYIMYDRIKVGSV